jgi:hypothetical protein
MRSGEDVYCSLGCTLKNGKPARHQAYGTRCRHKNMVPSTSVEQQPKELVENDNQHQEIQVDSSVEFSPDQQFGEEDSRSSNSEVGNVQTTSVASIVAALQRPQDQSLIILLPWLKVE